MGVGRSSRALSLRASLPWGAFPRTGGGGWVLLLPLRSPPREGKVKGSGAPCGGVSRGGLLANRLCCAATTKKCRIVDVVYNASNNELVRTKTLVKGACHSQAFNQHASHMCCTLSLPPFTVLRAWLIVCLSGMRAVCFSLVFTASCARVPPSPLTTVSLVRRYHHD